RDGRSDDPGRAVPERRLGRPTNRHPGDHSPRRPRRLPRPRIPPSLVHRPRHTIPRHPLRSPPTAILNILINECRPRRQTDVASPTGPHRADCGAVSVSSSSRVSRAAEGRAVWPVPKDQTIRQATDADYRYIGVDTTRVDVGQTVRRIQDAIPEIHTQSLTAFTAVAI